MAKPKNLYALLDGELHKCAGPEAVNTMVLEQGAVPFFSFGGKYYAVKRVTVELERVPGWDESMGWVAERIVKED